MLAGAEPRAQDGMHGHPAVTATLPSVTLSVTTIPGPSTESLLLIALQCHHGARAAEGPGMPLPGLGPHPGPHPCPHPWESTRPRGPQEMAVLCHGRCLLLTPRSGTSPGTSWLVATGLVGFPGHPPAHEDGDDPWGVAPTPRTRLPAPRLAV